MVCRLVHMCTDPSLDIFKVFLITVGYKRCLIEMIQIFSWIFVRKYESLLIESVGYGLYLVALFLKYSVFFIFVMVKFDCLRQKILITVNKQSINMNPTLFMTI